MNIIKNYFFIIFFIISLAYSQTKSAIQFWDSTGTNKTGKIGWSGDAQNGYFFVNTPQKGDLIKSTSDGIEINGTVKGNKFLGDGSGLTNLPASNVTVQSVTGLVDSLSKKASIGSLNILQNQIGAKADTTWVNSKLLIKADTTYVNLKVSSKADALAVNALTTNMQLKADTAWVNTKLQIKADTGWVSSQLGVKADTTWVNLKVSSKADTLAVNTLTTNMQLKADTAWVNTKLQIKADTGWVSSQLSIKADTTWVKNAISASGTGEIPDGGITTSKIADNAVTNNKLGSLGTQNTIPMFGANGLTDSYITQTSNGLSVINSDIAFQLKATSSAKSAYVYCQGDNYDHIELRHFGMTYPGTYAGLNYADLGRIFASNANALLIAHSGYCPIVFSTNATERMRIAGNGNIGIGTTTPEYTLDVNGIIRGSNVTVPSDIRYKTNITPIDSALLKVSKLKGVYFDFNRSAYPKKNFPEGKQIGLIAQDVEKVLPEVVTTDKEGYKSISYDKITALLIEAIKEQQEEISQLKKEIAVLKANMSK